jgi:Zn-dependent M28 family amino/carboxypeptidase
MDGMFDVDGDTLEAALRTHVDQLAGVIGPRPLAMPAAFRAAAAYVERGLSVAGYPVARQVYAVDGEEVGNFIAELPGGRLRDEIVVVGAHYDTVPGTPGADDNASAVAVLIEVARLMRQMNPARTVRFVGFACEEPPYCYTSDMGSRVYARECRVKGEKVVGMLCLEMVGFYSTERGSQKVPASIPRVFHRLFPQRGDFLGAVANLRSWRLLLEFGRGFKRAVKFPLFSIALPERVQEIRRSDNSSFWDQGYPALMLTDTSFLRNANYHQASDLPETLDYERMARVAVGVAGGAAWVAGVR